MKNIDTPKGIIQFPDNMSDEEINNVLSKEFTTPVSPAAREAPDMSSSGNAYLNWGDVPGPMLSNAADQLGTGIRVLQNPIGAVAKAAKDVYDNPVEMAKNLLYGAVTSPARMAAGAITQLPGGAQLDTLLGGTPDKRLANENYLRQQIAENPIGTALLAVPMAKGATAEAAAARAVKKALPSDAAARMAAYGDKANLLDVMPEGPARDKVIRILKKAHTEDLRPLHEAMSVRDKQAGADWRSTVEQSANLPQDALLNPDLYVQGVKDKTAKIVDTATAKRQSVAAMAQARINAKLAADHQVAVAKQTAEHQAATAKQIADYQASLAKQAADRAAAEAKLSQTVAQRNETYAKAFDQGYNLPKDEATGLPRGFEDIISTPQAKAIWERFNKTNDPYEITRGKPMGDLERLDKLELVLAKEGKSAGMGTPQGQAMVQLAQELRFRLASPDIPASYRIAQTEHISKVQQAAAIKAQSKIKIKPPKPLKLPPKIPALAMRAAPKASVPTDIRNVLETPITRAEELARLSSESEMKNLRDKQPNREGYISANAPLVNSDPLLGELEKQAAFSASKKALPKGSDLGAFRQAAYAAKNTLPYGFGISLLGMGPMGWKLAAGLGAGTAIAKGATVLRQTAVAKALAKKIEQSSLTPKQKAPIILYLLGGEAGNRPKMLGE